MKLSERIGAVLAEEPMAVVDPSRNDSLHALAAIRRDLGVGQNVRPYRSSFLTFREGTSNKFHYFAVFNVLSSHADQWVAANAFGRIGYEPKVVVFSQGDQQSVMAAYNRKVDDKMNKGYGAPTGTVDPSPRETRRSQDGPYEFGKSARARFVQR